jgi:hypothetical protein
MTARPKKVVRKGEVPAPAERSDEDDPGVEPTHGRHRNGTPMCNVGSGPCDCGKWH